MSFTEVTEAVPRLNRGELAVPVSEPRAIHPSQVRLVDLASIRQAQGLVKKAELLAGR